MDEALGKKEVPSMEILSVVRSGPPNSLKSHCWPPDVEENALLWHQINISNLSSVIMNALKLAK